MLRKPLWHPSSTFKYLQEIGEEGLALALKHVCLPFEPVLDQDEDATEEDHQPDYSVVIEHGHKVIDLSLDDNDEPQTEAGPSHLPDTPADDSDIGKLQAIEELVLDHFARDEESMTLEELLQALNVDRLKLIVKATKTRCNKMKVGQNLDNDSRLTDIRKTTSSMRCCGTERISEHWMLLTEKEKLRVVFVRPNSLSQPSLPQSSRRGSV